MSTAEIYLEPDVISELIRLTLADDEMVTWGVDDNKYGIGPYISFYIYHSVEEKLSLAEKIVAIYEEFETLVDEPFQKIFKNSTEVWLGSNDKRLPKKSLFEQAKESLADEPCEFWFGATDRNIDAASPRWSIYGYVDKFPQMGYSTVKLNFRQPWYNQNKEIWSNFVNRCIEELKPEHCYSGFEISSGPHAVMGNYEAETMERVCVDYFYGLDIDHQMKMGFHSHDDDDGYVNPSRLGAGIRTPTWCFMLSPYWLCKLGKTEEQIRQELDDPRITITAYPYPKNKHNPEGVNGLWIQLGELDLYPVGEGKPELLVKANKLIQPIRCDRLAITTLDAWDDDPNPRFDDFTSVTWMRRFDDGVDWLDYRCPNSPLPSGVYEAKPGQSVPKAGVWYAVNAPDMLDHHLEAGQQLPFKETNEDGEPILWRRRLEPK